MENRFNEIIFGFIFHKDKKNQEIAHIFDIHNKTHLFEINDKDKSVLVSREYIWDVLAEEFSLTDKEVQIFLNEMVLKCFELNGRFVCDRMIF